ncbi:helix-turn-helix domain-containing protein [Actinoplanes sp. TBRC 11911]|uniref:helix-turn-helix domain-containing protein n=1 Tax=Actinoplanes sp. TBRC 11911 TaxID=2729386 RepID=UPI00145F0C7B|nr:helix-turn-helix domain-containing protein [Actinoplanes sp. TBRC 11911]NMO54635.1 helix-turn-helix domain-containing protein [Actinoplanes sp. TBRC 11911]
MLSSVPAYQNIAYSKCVGGAAVALPDPARLFDSCGQPHTAAAQVTGTPRHDGWVMWEDSNAVKWAEDCHAFGRLSVQPIDAGEPSGKISATSLGSMSALQITGTPQVLRRTRRAVRQDPLEIVKLYIPLTPAALRVDADDLVALRPGQMVFYDLGRPYDAVHEQEYSAIALTFPRDTLALPGRVLEQWFYRPFPCDQGAGAVVADFTRSAIREGGFLGISAGRLGDAGLHLIAGMLGAQVAQDEKAADALRIKIFHYVRDHLSEPGLTHDRVAAAHRMAPRTLHRLFEDQPFTVTEYIRMRRLETVRSELTNPLFRHLSIARIAARWGFLSQPHFTRAFQARYGVTPSSVRRSGLDQKNVS